MNILFLSNWSATEGITRATVFPIISALEKKNCIEQIILCTIEPEVTEPVFREDRVVHIPLVSRGKSGISKFVDFLTLPFALRNIIRKNSIDLLWCRGSSAGALGALVNFVTKIPYVVDSFEPHSLYMISSGTWKRSSPKFWIQYWLEHLIKQRATALLPVSFTFYKKLVSDGLTPSKLYVLPCVVDLEKFAFDHVVRNRMRTKLGIANNAVVGIYIGKFGDLYLDDEAFIIFREAFVFWKEEFFLVVLSEMNRMNILSRLNEQSIPLERVFVEKVMHTEVPSYLSAADFGFATIKPASALEYCSPIKHGEYWAADLPILTTLPFGDDAKILNEEGGGCIYDIFDKDAPRVFETLDKLICKGRNGHQTTIATKYRNIDRISKSIDFVLRLSGNG